DLDRVKTWRQEIPCANRSQVIDAKEFVEIRFEKVSFHHKGFADPTLDTISFAIKRGEVVGIVGPSGAGKTTLVDVMLGLLPPDRGHVLINDKVITQFPQGFFGYVPQDPFVSEDTLARNIAIGVSSAEIDQRRIQNALEIAALSDLVERLPQGLSSR